MTRHLMSRGERATAGFTVIELVAVLAVIGVFVALAAPHLHPTRYQVEAAAHTLGSNLLGAQRLALVRQHDVILGFDAAAGEIVFHEDADNDGIQDGGERVRREPLGDNVVFALGGAPPRGIGPNPISFEKTRGGLRALIFHRSGSVSEAGGVYVTSRRAALTGASPEETWALEVERATGRPSWYRYTSSGWKRAF